MTTELLAEGAAAYGRGDTAAALEIFERAAAGSTGGMRLAAMVNAASMCDELGEYERAIGTYRTVLDEMPSDAVKMKSAAMINLSQSLQHIGDLDGAQTSLEQAREVLLTTDEHRDIFVACLLSLTAVALHRGQWAQACEIATESLDAAVRYAPSLAGHPLMNLAAANFETGRRDLAEDFAAQAQNAFQAAGDQNAVAETQQNLALMRVRSNRLDDAEPLLLSSQEYFSHAGNAHRYAIGLKALACLVENRGEIDRACSLYEESLEHFRALGAVLDVAAVCSCLATLDFGAGRVAVGEDRLAEAFTIYADNGLGVHCAEIDYWHAGLLESVSADRALQLAVPAALAIDAVRCTFVNGNQRAEWNRQVADPAMALAFRLAYACGETALVGDLIETQCAGTAFDSTFVGDVTERVDHAPLDPPTVAAAPEFAGTLTLGSALADVAASAGLPVSPPPRIELPGGRIALENYIATAESRYGHPVRDRRVLPSW